MQAGLAWVMTAAKGQVVEGAEALRKYQAWLYGQGAEDEGITEENNIDMSLYIWSMPGRVA